MDAIRTLKYEYINSLIAWFWWGTITEKRKMSWVSWKKIATANKD